MHDQLSLRSERQDDPEDEIIHSSEAEESQSSDSFLQRWLKRNDSHDTDRKTKENAPAGRFRELFSSLFSKVVEAVSQENYTEESKVQNTRLTGELFGLATSSEELIIDHERPAWDSKDQPQVEQEIDKPTFVPQNDVVARTSNNSTEIIFTHSLEHVEVVPDSKQSRGETDAEQKARNILAQQFESDKRTNTNSETKRNDIKNAEQRSDHLEAQDMIIEDDHIMESDFDKRHEVKDDHTVILPEYTTNSVQEPEETTLLSSRPVPISEVIETKRSEHYMDGIQPRAERKQSRRSYYMDSTWIGIALGTVVAIIGLAVYILK